MGSCAFFLEPEKNTAATGLMQKRRVTPIGTFELVSHY